MDLDVKHFAYIFYILTRIPWKLKCGQVLCEHKHLLATKETITLIFEKNFSTTFYLTALSRNYSTSIGQKKSQNKAAEILYVFFYTFFDL